MATQLRSRNHAGYNHGFVSPWTELNAGLWSLFIGATIFLVLRVYCKTMKRYGLWYDDYILLASWILLLANNILIVYEFGNGYMLKDSRDSWSEHMRILINISSCGTLIGQAWTKTAFGVTLLRMTSQWQRWVLWFCIVSMNVFMFFKVLIQWAKICGNADYQSDWRLDFCVTWEFREDFKEGGNVYNIIMDFIFATFPWLITRQLEMRRAEKIGLSLAMSLGMIVAIVSAIRVSWKDKGNQRDEYYLFRNGLSQVWYSSEITGTIIVQCIPILRPILRQFTTTMTSRNLQSTGNRQSATWVSRLSSRHGSLASPNDVATKAHDRIALREIPEDEHGEDNWEGRQSWLSQTDRKLHPTSPSSVGSPFETPSGMQRGTSQYSGASLDLERNTTSHSHISFDSEEEGRNGLSPTPRRFPT